MTFEERYAAYKALVEEKLGTYFPGPGLNEVMRYSLMAGGKRLRPVLTLAFFEAAGWELCPGSVALDYACAVEMLHTYSLIHDDLPCMDNAALRRGRPTCHKVYGETAAVLAGDALQAAAFQRILSAAGGYRLSVNEFAALELARAAGAGGMCLGQYRDTLERPAAEEDLIATSRAKTGALLGCACRLGVLAASAYTSGPEDLEKAAAEYGEALGLAFQIQDDILDVTADPAALGKDVGADEANGKLTFATLLGVEECRRRVADYTDQAKAALEKGAWWTDGPTVAPALDFLRALADSLKERER